MEFFEGCLRAGVCALGGQYKMLECIPVARQFFHHDAGKLVGQQVAFVCPVE